MPAVGELKSQRENDYGDQEVEAGHRVVIGESSALDDDAFDYIGYVFAFIPCGFDDFEDFFPLNDLDGVFFFVEKLGDERSGEAVAFIFVAVDLDAVLEGFVGSAEGFDGGGDFHSGRDKDFDKVDGALSGGVDAVEDEAAGGGVDEVDDVVELVAERVDIFAVKRRDEGLVQLDEKMVGDFVAFMLDGFDDLHLLGDARVV